MLRNRDNQIKTKINLQFTIYNLQSKTVALFLVIQFLTLGLFVFDNSNVAQASTNTDLPYLKVWERTDQPVALGAAQRSWYWGPAPFSITQERYDQSPGGARGVQYWDKSRMEISNPAANQSSKWYVTNGLLVREMVTGKVQMGDNANYDFIPASVPVSGDSIEYNPDSPTYASFKDVVSLAMDKRALPSTRAVTSTIDKAGNVGVNVGLATRYPETALVYFEDKLGHNIPGPLWRFMNASGPVTVNHRLVNQVIEDWTFAFGLPISEAYWTRSRVAGQEKDVLVQLFERRILTYTPSNATAFQVEMGNVGRHYFNWRYGAGSPAGKAPAYTQPATRLTIPAIGVDAAIEYVTLASDGTMDVPARPENVAWYKPGARPGETGNAVIAGHLDYAGVGPVVFWNLNKLKAGDMVYVTTTLGTKLSFRVTSTEIYPFNRGPLERIFGTTTSSNLNLITCNGAFDRGSANYSERLVVYTTLVI